MLHHVHDNISAYIMPPHTSRKRPQSLISFMIDRSWSMSTDFTDYHNNMKRKTRFQWAVDAVTACAGYADFYFFDKALDGPMSSPECCKLQLECTDIFNCLMDYSKKTEPGSHLIVITDGDDERFESMIRAPESKDPRSLQDLSALRTSLRSLESLVFVGIGDAWSLATQPAEALVGNKGMSVRIQPPGLEDGIRCIFQQVSSTTRPVDVEVELANGCKRTISVNCSLTDPTVTIVEDAKVVAVSVPQVHRVRVVRALIRHHIHQDNPIPLLDILADLTVSWFPRQSQEAVHLIIQITVAMGGLMRASRSIAWGCCHSLEVSELADLGYLCVPKHAIDSIISRYAKHRGPLSDIVCDVVGELTPEIPESLPF